MISTPSCGDRVLVTGSTGFIGHHVLAALLGRGVPCAALVRPDIEASTRRLADLLAALDVDLAAEVAAGRLILLEGDLNGTLPRAIGARIGSILHAAASTDFDRNAAGDPWRTNVEGTRRLLDWAADRAIASVHLVSSAFRCGVADRPVAESVGTIEPSVHNEYERSKWQAEADAAAWADRHGATLTIYRPSIVVGHSVTGRATGFGGFYIMARANEVLSQNYEPDDPARRRTGIRVVGRADGPQNLVPVDYVAALIAHAISDARWHGQVYHLTHPDPPTNATIKRAIDEHFDIDGSGFVDPDDLDPATLSDVERLFYDASRPVRQYLIDTPVFERGNASRLEEAAGAACPAYDVAALRDLIAWARSARWGRARKRARAVRDSGDALIGTYFSMYLPRYLPLSRVARMTALTVTMTFELEDVPNGQWWCRFVDGRLVQVRQGDASLRSDFTCRTSRDVFWAAVAGNVDPQTVFMNDQAGISGDVESAMKMAVILHRFNRECPCTPRTLIDEEARPCPVTA